MSENNAPLKAEKGRALEAYQEASKRLAQAKWKEANRRPNAQKLAYGDSALRQAEVCAIVEFLCEKGLLTTDQFLLRAADSMNNMAQICERGQSAIFVPNQTGRG